LATTAAAQDNPCSTKLPRLPAVGAWSEYQADSGNFRMMYVGHETAGERLEMAMTRTMRNGQTGNMVMQIVVPSFPYEMTQAKEVVMQMGENPPMKLSQQMLDMMRSRMPSNQSISPEACNRLARVGSESVTVPAGTFSTTHYRDAQDSTDVWIDTSVPFGMVKVVARHGTIMLKAKGTGGTTGIHGTPQEMGPGMMGPQGGRRPGGR
ncbi:MAG TPA: hypothetical protein VFI13_00390, partial [Gemmatimonadales bacterium]|nr:hypothetical protein [Gemmatimonadales bacterium]